jgi:aminopeptidase N
MGDDRFWTGIRDYYARHRNGNATTADFRRAMEQAAGRDLGPFFEQWLYRGGVPRLTGTWRWDSAAKQVIVELHQTQAGDPFQLPIEIGITSVGSRPRIERVSLSARDGRFVFPAEAVPAGVELDPNVRLLFDGRIEQRP